MPNKKLAFTTFMIALFLSVGPYGFGQGPGQGLPPTGRGSMAGNMKTVESQDWHVFGRVKTLKGDAVSDAKVRLDVGGGIGSVQEVSTDMMGRFSTNFKLNAQQYERLHVKVLVTKSDYLDAREVVDFPADHTWEIEVTMREAGTDPDQLSQDDLIQRLVPRLKSPRDTLPKSAQRRYEQGRQEFLDKHEAGKASELLKQLSSKQKTCVDCATLASLAMLKSGNWSGATQQAGAAAEEVRKSEHPRPEPLLILGVMESWKNEPKKAASFFMEALKSAPQDPVALEELGRSQLLAGNNEAAEEYLGKAIAAGAPPEAKLLRVRALLAMNDIPTADQQMDNYLAGREVKECPRPARILYGELQERVQLSAYAGGKSFLNEPLAQIEKVVPELKGLRPASDQKELPGILQQVGGKVEAFFSNFPDTVSTEQVRQERLKKGDKIAASSDATFRYMLMAKPRQKGLGLEEYRTNDMGARTALGGLDQGFMLTSGFASTSLFFHPDYQSGADFRLLGRQEFDKLETYVVAFAQNPDRARISELFTANRESVLILLQGIAWVDPSTGQILRMRTDLLKPATKVRLARQTTEIMFDPVEFQRVSKELWLPHQVVVTVDWKGRKFRNEHAYSHFRLFNVKTQEKQQQPDLPESPSGPAE